MLTLAAGAILADMRCFKGSIFKSSHQQGTLFKPTNTRSVPYHSRKTIVAAEKDNGGSEPLGEDLIARLKAAEEEAQKLRKELAAAKSQTTDVSSSEDTEQPAPAKGRRIDGGDLRRETLAFVESRPRNWLSESDVEFFTGAGPSETEAAANATEQESAIVQRRLLIGIGLTVALGAFALVPTEKLQRAPSKPLFFYLAPIIRVQTILEEIEKVIPEGDYDRLKSLLALVEGPPNNIQDNLRSAVASLTDSKQAREAEDVSRDLYEYLKSIDYQIYYDTMPGGKQQQKLFEFSLQSTKAAQLKIKEFLKLMPKDQVEAAESQVSTFNASFQ